MNAPFCSFDTSQLETGETPREWIWEGYLARGQFTLFTSLWKSGKTTLLAHLLAQRREGSSLAGKAVRAGPETLIESIDREKSFGR